MRVFIAATCPYFLKCVERAFRYIPAAPNAYMSTVHTPGARLFRTLCATRSGTVCLVQPCDRACKLQLETSGEHKYILTCPPATTNLRVLCRRVLLFLDAHSQQFDIVILPSELWGEALPSEHYAAALRGAYLDVLSR